VGRKKIYQWDMLVYAVGMLVLVFAVTPRENECPVTTALTPRACSRSLACRPVVPN
jgi:hypothetical protein